ncbi:carbohydrate ABC transporter permease [Gracilibacillus alcaliphilus]|uniref:carbohydrate ABC transporter permease n=1 Tax=Gracilibacillus alcaliphilus TaxID=1401441 RepID=UPI001958C8ED|nr:carbohydrate ABC transporter permease [Gracilibacillus alcaliphilus]MBM7676190.1 ABC-type glycerol-3-phosphate transport system permease component [Gracilibacillus alcaliphilus]
MEKFVSKYITFLFVTILMLIFIFPLIWMLILSTNSRTEIYSFPPPLLPGTELVNNFQNLIAQIPFFMNLWNSVYIAVANSALILFVCSFAAYGFARFTNAPGNRWIFAMVIAAIMIPPLAGIIPWFMQMRWLGWIDTHWPLIIPAAAYPFGVFWMYQYIKQAVPNELYEACKMDGASDFRIYIQMVIPLIRPGLGALAILSFLNSWQNFQLPLIVLNSTEKFTIPLALTNLTSQFGTDVAGIMLGTSISVVPIFIAFILASRHFIEGLTSGSVKS